MELTLKLKQDIIDLLEFVQTKKNVGGTPWADSTASRECFGHGEYVGNLRKWDGGTGSPTLEKTLKFERFLIEQISAEEYETFISTRSAPKPIKKAKPAAAKRAKPEPAPAVDDDWN